MKKLLIASLLISATTAHAEVNIVPLEMALGYWETTTQIEESDMMKNMLKNLPESQQAKVKEMMQGSMQVPVVKQCITPDSLKDMEAQIKQSLGKQKGAEHCQFTATVSNPKEFKGTLNCAGQPITIHSKVINAKHHESKVVSIVPGMGTNKISSTGKWLSSTCPAGVK